MLEVQDFGALVHKCREYEDVYNERVASFKSKKQLPQGKGKQPLAPSGKGFKRGGASKSGFSVGKSSGRSSYAPQAVKCGKEHYTHQCKETEFLCFKCGKPGHMSRDCGGAKSEPASEEKSKKPQANRLRSTGRVFALSGTEAAESEDLIQGTCLIQGVPLIVLYDSGATHSFIAYDCVEKLSLHLSSVFEFICGCSYG